MVEDDFQISTLYLSSITTHTLSKPITLKLPPLVPRFSTRINSFPLLPFRCIGAYSCPCALASSLSPLYSTYLVEPSCAHSLKYFVPPSTPVMIQQSSYGVAVRRPLS